jgi:hypothetical protein
LNGSSRTDRTAVKAPGGIARYLEGWQPGLLAVLVAGVPTWLAVPRPVEPVEIPEPFLEPRALERQARDDRALAEAAERERADDLRELGSAIRAYNLATMEGDGRQMAALRRAAAEAQQRTAAHGEAALARLRAYMLRAFLRELRRWEETGEETDELRELGGSFIASARANGWLAGRRILADETVRSVLFKMRWAEVTTARGPGLDLTPLENRALYRFLILHPPRTSPADYRLRKIDALSAIDPDYPADLAKGVVLFRLHRHPEAKQALRRHLQAHPDGPSAVRARNYLRAALEVDPDPAADS